MLKKIWIMSQRGDLSRAQQMFDSGELTLSNVRSCRALQVACKNGRLELAKWLHTMFTLTANDDARAENNYSLKVACENGDTPLVQWLITVFELTTDDARECNALSLACEYGHLNTAQLLFEAFDLDIEDVRVDNNHALHEVCSRGYIDMARWMHCIFNLTIADARTAFLPACTNGRLICAQWLHNTFGLSAEDTTEGLRAACRYRHLHIVQWISETFGNTHKGLHEVTKRRRVDRLDMSQWVHALSTKEKHEAQEFQTYLTSGIYKSAMRGTRRSLNWLEWSEDSGSDCFDLRNSVESTPSRKRLRVRKTVYADGDDNE